MARLSAAMVTSPFGTVFVALYADVARDPSVNHPLYLHLTLSHRDWSGDIERRTCPFCQGCLMAMLCELIWEFLSSLLIKFRRSIDYPCLSDWWFIPKFWEDSMFSAEIYVLQKQPSSVQVQLRTDISTQTKSAEFMVSDDKIHALRAKKMDIPLQQ